MPDLPRERMQVRGCPAWSVSRSGSARVMGKERHLPPTVPAPAPHGPCSSQKRGTCPLGSHLVAALDGGTGDRTGCSGLVAPCPVPTALPACAGGSCHQPSQGPGGCSGPAEVRSRSSHGISGCTPRSSPGASPDPPVHGPSPASRSRPGAPLPSAAGKHLFPVRGAAAWGGGQQEKNLVSWQVIYILLPVGPA